MLLCKYEENVKTNECTKKKIIIIIIIIVSSLSRLNKTILAHYSRFNKIATLGYIMAH